MDGSSLKPALEGGSVDHAVIADYLAIGPCVPCRMVRMGRFKYMYTHGHDEQLFDIEEDPNETRNLADDARHGAVKEELRGALLSGWDPEDINRRVIASQRRRIAINRSPGTQPRWDFVYRSGDEARFVRNREVDATKGRYRLPVIESVPPDRTPMTAAEIDLAMTTGELP